MQPQSSRFRRAAAAAGLTLSLFAGACSSEVPSVADDTTSDAPATEPAPPASVPTPAEQGAPPPGEVAVAPGQDADQQLLTPEQIPEVVARIDGVAISRDDLLARAAEARGALAQRGLRPPPPSRAFLRDVLDDIVGNRLMARDLTNRGEGAPETEIEEQMAAIRSPFPADEEFDKALAARGFDRARLRRDVAESLTVKNWVAGTIVPSIEVDEAEIRAFYEANTEQMIEPEKVRARHILLRVEPQAPEEEKSARRAQIDELRGRLLAGGDFAAEARQLSDDKTSGERGGDLGWFYRGRMVPSFEEAVFGLQPNQVSEVVETRFGFHLIELLEKQAERQVPFEEARPRIESTVKQRKLEEKIRARVNELGATVEIEILL
jgi:peptidyl-prolyl cis-trans isomerase C